MRAPTGGPRMTRMRKKPPQDHQMRARRPRKKMARIRARGRALAIAVANSNQLASQSQQGQQNTDFKGKFFIKTGNLGQEIGDMFGHRGARQNFVIQHNRPACHSFSRKWLSKEGTRTAGGSRCGSLDWRWRWPAFSCGPI